MRAHGYIYYGIAVLIFLNAVNEDVLRYIFVILGLFFVALFLYANYDTIKKTMDDVKNGTDSNPPSSSTPQSSPAPSVPDPIGEITKFKSYNEPLFTDAMQSYNLYKHSLSKLSEKNAGTYVNDLKLYLDSAIEKFRQIAVSIPTKKYIDSYETESFDTDAEIDSLHNTLKRIYTVELYNMDKALLENNKKKEINIFSDYRYPDDLSITEGDYAYYHLAHSDNANSMKEMTLSVPKYTDDIDLSSTPSPPAAPKTEASAKEASTKEASTTPS